MALLRCECRKHKTSLSELSQQFVGVILHRKISAFMFFTLTSDDLPNFSQIIFTYISLRDTKTFRRNL